MSGGRWNYENDNACREVFGWMVSADYDLVHPDTMAMSKMARRLNPLEDRAISELVSMCFACCTAMTGTPLVIPAKRLTAQISNTLRRSGCPRRLLRLRAEKSTK